MAWQDYPNVKVGSKIKEKTEQQQHTGTISYDNNDKLEAELDIVMTVPKSEYDILVTVPKGTAQSFDIALRVHDVWLHNKSKKRTDLSSDHDLISK